MAYGAYMSIKNTMSTPATMTLGEVHCFYDHGEEGSNPSIFDGAVIAPGGTFPPGGPQYIEAKGSGTCAIASSFFDLGVKGGSVVQVQEGQHEYIVRSAPGISPNVQNTDPQAKITITLH
ncbi:MAG TPA: hypothetical protein VGC13_32235 [Longimicrobium sp.]|jgi:hypothetical protein|uniref:hypothetical protein n=1 Tax=Longimicrobium sp. TaxID=2029185 RepID=UPI002ED8A101